MAIIGTSLNTAKKLLTENELVAIPTETVYGLAGNALSREAVTKIFQVKNRPYFDPLIVHIPNILAAQKLVTELPEKAEQLANKFWPGPLTILLTKREIIPDLVTAGMDRVGIRCPAHPLAHELLNSLDFPLAAPSANPFGYVSPTKAEHVQEQLGDKIPYILEGGQCQVGIESTIIGFEANDTVVYRMGGVSVEDIEGIIGPVKLMTQSTSNPRAPGQLESHYAPRKKVVLHSEDFPLNQFKGKRLGALVYQKLLSGIPNESQIILSPSGNLAEAAQNLFGSLRALDKKDIDWIVAELVPNEGLGRAINDRLKRAATSL